MCAAICAGSIPAARCATKRRAVDVGGRSLATTGIASALIHHIEERHHGSLTCLTRRGPRLLLSWVTTGLATGAREAGLNGPGRRGPRGATAPLFKAHPTSHFSISLARPVPSPTGISRPRFPPSATATATAHTPRHDPPARFGRGSTGAGPRLAPDLLRRPAPPLLSPSEN